MDTPEKVSLESMDISEDKREGLRLLLPEVFSDEGKLDFDKLRRALGEWTEAGSERFGLNWHGKAECMKVIMETSVATLSPVRAESVDFDNTDNLFIEGDNLEVLKLLQKSYFGKVKMIYIDPPYNTGKEFIYPDKYSESLETYLQYTGQVDGNGHKFATNTEATGRYHSRWLSMMYPRLYLARNLLREDGVIFISIDDHEQANLKKLCDEIFGEENFVTEFIWEKKKKPAFLHRNVGKLVEYVLCYTKNSDESHPFSVEETIDGKKTPINNAGNAKSVLTFPAGSVHFNMDDQTVLPQDMSEGNILTKLLEKVVIKNGVNKNDLILEGEWRYSQSTIDEIVRNGDEIRISKIPFRPNRIKRGEEIKKMKNVLSPTHYQMSTNEDATEHLAGLFQGKDIFDNPKPHQLIQAFIKAVSYQDNDSIVLDFFAGSGTTAEAVMSLNAEDGGSRKFICVQLPENLSEEKADDKIAIDFCDSLQMPRTIAEISKERIRCAAQKIAEEQNGHMDLDCNGKLDLGFKVFKLAQSNFKEWQSDLEKTKENGDLAQQLTNHIDRLNPASSDEDIVYELLLKCGRTLTTAIEKIVVEGVEVFSVEEGRFLICVDKNLTEKAINAMAQLNPQEVVCLDACFNDNDQLKANAVQSFQIQSRAVRSKREYEPDNLTESEQRLESDIRFKTA